MISQSNAPIDNSARGEVAEVEKPTFTEASERANIVSGESIPTLFGKIKKFFTDLKAVAFSGSYNDLSNKPTIPTVNNGTLTIQKNGTNVTTFSANQSGDATANITVPTVNNGTLTIQKNGTNVQTFTANQSSNATANITVPTKTSELTNNSSYISGTADTNATANTIAKRDGSGYLKAAYFNQASATENINSFSNCSYAFFSSDGWLRKTDFNNFVYSLHLGFSYNPIDTYLSSEKVCGKSWTTITYKDGQVPKGSYFTCVTLTARGSGDGSPKFRVSVGGYTSNEFLMSAGANRCVTFFGFVSIPQTANYSIAIQGTANNATSLTIAAYESIQLFMIRTF